ncbi:MAG: sugar phosphate isomerase/epimerase [Agathobacter sp.]|nr:sugar phosphate isomerase/epimerase [Agathobacter sp.]
MKVIYSQENNIDEIIAECGYILLRNQYKEVNGHFVRGENSDARELKKKVDALNEGTDVERYGVCVDVGVLNLCGQNAYEYMHVLGHRVKAVIIRENDGQHNDALLPFTCVANGHSQMDWLGVIRGLREIHFDGLLIMDFSDTSKTFSPLLRPQLMELAKSVGEFIKWQVEIETFLEKYSPVALFGAGNMCRNYMKCYGEKFKPLFTCDNDASKWGKDFCGLEVKSPEALKNLPKDTVIMICNTHYFEIEQQLQEMGIENEITFFNDEYMPTFYFDRI